jgi:hypothetical protein
VTAPIALLIGVLTWLANQVKDTVVQTLLNGFYKGFRRNRINILRIVNKYRAYKSALEDKLRQMPFVYRLDSYVLSDYADVEVAPLEFGSLQIRTAQGSPS